TLTVTDANGCVNTQSATVSWFPQPVVDLSIYSDLLNKNIQPDTVYTCPTNPVTITATPGFTQYIWSHDAAETGNVTSIAPLVDDEVLVKLEAIDTNGCPANDSIRVIALDVPDEVLIGFKTDICVNEIISIAPIKDKIYRHYWSFNGITSTTDNYSSPTGGILTLTIENEYGCPASTNITIHQPEINFVGGIDKAILCYGTPYTFEVIPETDYSYKWSDNSTNLDFTAIEPGTYQLETTHNTLGCKLKAPVTLEWHPGKLFDVQDSLVVCQSGLHYKIQGDTQMINYEWRLDNDPTIITTENYIITDPALESGKRVFHVSAQFVPPLVPLPNVYAPTAICPITQDFSFIVKSEPDPIYIDETYSCGLPSYTYEYNLKDYEVEILCICEGNEITLQGYNDYVSYQWSKLNAGAFENIGNGTERTLTVFTPGIYKLEAQQPSLPGITGCISIGITEVRILDNPIIDITPEKQVCTDDLFTITNTDVDAASHTYQWSYDNETIASGAGLFEIIDQTRPGEYSVEATGTNGCVSNATTIIYEPTPPNINLLNELRCSNEPLSLLNKWNTEVPLIPTYNSHRWYIKQTDGTFVAENNDEVTLSSGDYVFRLEVLVQENPLVPICPFYYDFRLIVKQAPDFTIGNDKEICDGESITLMSNKNFPLYEWIELSAPANTLSTNNALTVTTSGTYQLTAWDIYNNLTCSSTQQATITVKPLPTITLASPIDPICDGQTVTTITLQDALLYDNITWSTGAVDDGKTSITTNKAGTYTVTARSINSQCTNTQTATIAAYPRLTLTLPADKGTI
ncbi:hypothetical protein, partial [Breznakibacter xylanolyticus]|uniref:hypothetical protein n=1 Tax=Breznakibacter xylanolyticus TaxID=990 RepID=UPI0014749888